MKTILVVEDDPAIRKLLTLALKTKGWDAVEADGAKAATERIGQLGRPCAIVLDVTLGDDRDRYALCRAWKATRDLGDMPIVMLTARGSNRNWGAHHSRCRRLRAVGEGSGVTPRDGA